MSSLILFGVFHRRVKCRYWHRSAPFKLHELGVRVETIQRIHCKRFKLNVLVKFCRAWGREYPEQLVCEELKDICRSVVT